jgi:23S rRNA maturation mini-RNase III
VDRGGLHRTVCDYVSGMTDRYLLDEHARLSKEARKPTAKRTKNTARKKTARKRKALRTRK